MTMRRRLPLESVAARLESLGASWRFPPASPPRVAPARLGEAERANQAEGDVTIEAAIEPALDEFWVVDVFHGGSVARLAAGMVVQTDDRSQPPFRDQHSAAFSIQRREGRGFEMRTERRQP